jgi:hypothetical protein
MNDRDTKPEKLVAEARMSTRLAKIAAGKRVTRLTRWPQLDFDVLLRVLSNADTQACHARAIARFADLKIPIDAIVTANLFQDEIVLQVIHEACRDPEHPEQTYAVDADDLRENTTNRQREAMMEIYADFAAEVDPDAEQMSSELVGGIVDAIKKKDSVRLKSYGSRALATFMLSSVSPPST